MTNALAWRPPIGHADIAPSRFERIEGDGYFTLDSEWIVPALLGAVPIKGRVLEPAAGRGHISLELKRAGLIVESFDIRAYENPLVPSRGGNESALWRSRRAGRDSRPPRDSRPLRGGAARARRLADRKSAPQPDSLASLVSRDRAADVPAAMGGADEVQRVAAAQFLLVRMGRATAPRGCMDPMGGEGPAKPHRSPLSGLHVEGASV